ncbi:MAG: SRPBCC family protein [Deltaproteobacteria bacterium]|nr:SRPBCC family protein [Deltaproteobacteria bacterium]MBI3294071.1 SRPBCC family protein [Deltaproteobacteria bacterium]
MINKILYVLAVFVGVFLITGLLAPTEFSVEREITIAKPREQVFAFLTSLKNGQSWSPWKKLDPNMKAEYKGTDGTVGSVSSWDGNTAIGAGEQEIKSIVPNERIDLELRFSRPMQGASQVSFRTENSPVPHHTKVIWGMKSPSPFPSNVFCLLFNMPKKLGNDFEQGLANLKVLLEK